MTDSELTTAFTAELASTVGALVDAPCTAAPSGEGPQARWFVQVAFTGAITGHGTVAFDTATASRLAALVVGTDGEPPEASIREVLQELCTQAVTALGERAPFAGLRIVSTRVDAEPPDGQPRCILLSAGERFDGHARVWAVVENVMPLGETAPSAAPTVPANLELILDIDLPLAVRFGETELTLAELTRLSPGAIIDLGRPPEEPVDVLVNGRMVARGEVVVVAGNYGIRVTEVISPADRLRTVAA